MDSTHSNIASENNIASESSRLENFHLDDLDEACLDESREFLVFRES